MESLFNEYNYYQDLISKRNKVVEELASLSGKNDDDSIRRINEIGSILNDISLELNKFNTELIEKVSKYFEMESLHKRISNQIKEIEKISRKASDRMIPIKNAEGRTKNIDPSFVDDYKTLVQQKNNLRKEFFLQYKAIKDVTSIKKDDVIKTDNNEDKEDKEISYVLPEIKDYNDLSIDEKIKETEKRLQRIFDSSLLPNQGKKNIVTYNGEKKVIPVKYMGRYKETIRELNSLLDKKKNTVSFNDDKPNIKEENTVSISEDKPNIKEEYSYQIYKVANLVDLMEYKKEKQIELHPISVTFKDTPRVNLRKSLSCIKSKITIENIEKKLPHIWNIDKKAIKNFYKLEGKYLDGKMKVKKVSVNIANSAICKYETTKDKVTTISRSAKNKLKNKLQSTKEYFSDKKKIQEMKKDIGLKKAMEEVYGDKKENYLDYRIVNRSINIMDNVCFRINDEKSKIIDVSKRVSDRLKAPFIKLRDNMNNDVQRAELLKQIENIKRENLQKKEEITKIRVRTMGGYAATSAIIVISIILLIIGIFIAVRMILGY